MQLWLTLLGGRHNVHPPPFLLKGGGGLNLQTKFQKGGLDRISTFRGGGLGLFADLRGAWQERGGGVFEGGGGLRPQCTLWKGNVYQILAARLEVEAKIFVLSFV